MKQPIVDHSANGSRLVKTLSNPSKCDDVKEEMRSLMVQHKMLLESLKNVLERLVYPNDFFTLEFFQLIHWLQSGASLHSPR